MAKTAIKRNQRAEKKKRRETEKKKKENRGEKRKKKETPTLKILTPSKHQIKKVIKWKYIILKINICSMFNQNFDNFFKTLPSSKVKRGISTLKTQINKIKQKKIPQINKETENEIKIKTLSPISRFAPCSTKILTISSKPFQEAWWRGVYPI